jgi:hypothetical protein
MALSVEGGQLGKQLVARLQGRLSIKTEAEKRLASGVSSVSADRLLFFVIFWFSVFLWVFFIQEVSVVERSTDLYRRARLCQFSRWPGSRRRLGAFGRCGRGSVLVSERPSRGNRHWQLPFWLTRIRNDRALVTHCVPAPSNRSSARMSEDGRSCFGARFCETRPISTPRAAPVVRLFMFSLSVLLVRVEVVVRPVLPRSTGCSV